MQDSETLQMGNLANTVSQLNSSQGSSQWSMKDGTQVFIRPIRPDDEPLMVKFHNLLSNRTVYLRYFCSLSLATRTAHERLVRICFADPERETVLVASEMDDGSGDERILAVGRLNKLPNTNEAEMAVLVADDYQGCGLGTELLRRLIQVARDRKIDQITAEMLRDNIVMQSVLKKLGFRLRLFNDPRSVRAALRL
jgi:acetyltransferase